jgi:glutamyl-tRNA synthetase
MHVGNLRTALAAWLAARAEGGRLVLRIEDLDAPRVRPGAEEAILADLRWLGLDWDEGPDVGGPFGPYRQSERTRIYASALERLRSLELAYPCACSRAEVASSAPHGPDGAPVYPGRCRSLDPEEVLSRARESGRSPAWRFRVPEGRIGFRDAVMGERTEETAAEVGDFVLARSDGAVAYQLAVVVDDAAMEIGCVVRGADLLASTARQIHLHRALGNEPPPDFLHVPLVLSAEGIGKLSKRNRPEGVARLREAGWTPERLTGLLARSLGLPAPERCRPSDIVGLFDPERIVREDASLDLVG